MQLPSYPYWSLLIVKGVHDMKIRDLFENWGLTGIKLNFKFAEIEFSPSPEDEIAAWEMYVELITRITTQKLHENTGDEITALKSIHKMFAITRDILKVHGRKCDAFTKIAIIVLNQIIRPFTAKWHKLSIDGSLNNIQSIIHFRDELEELQINLRKYSGMLAEMAKVEDLTNITMEE